MESLLDGTFDQNRDRFRMIFDEIMYRGDEYFILKDFDSYLKASKKTEELYLDRFRWAKMCLVNVSKAGYFSSDRTIKQYNDEIWHLEPIKR